MDEPPVQGRPPAPAETALYEAYVQDLTGQSKLLDETSRELLKLQLAIPGIYIAALRLNAEGGQPLFTLAAFGCWLLALAVTLFGLYPRTYAVHDGVLRRLGPASGGAATLPEFYQRAARLKYNRLIWATALYFIGIGLAAWSVIGGSP